MAPLGIILTSALSTATVSLAVFSEYDPLQLWTSLTAVGSTGLLQPTTIWTLAHMLSQTGSISLLTKPLVGLSCLVRFSAVHQKLITFSSMGSVLSSDYWKCMTDSRTDEQRQRRNDRLLQQSEAHS
jgi:hypothetical protein